MIRVLLADDHDIIRDGLRRLLDDAPDIEVIADAADGRTAVELSQETRPDVVLMDVSMSDLNGIEATRQIRRKTDDVRVVILSMHSDESTVMGALEAGASGYLEKNCSAAEICTAIRDVAAGKSYLSSGVAGGVVSRAVGGHAPASEPLTEREREVLQLIAEGHSSKSIADALSVSVRTVSRHRDNLMQKLDLHSVADLTRYALREGITDL